MIKLRAKRLQTCPKCGFLIYAKSPNWEGDWIISEKEMEYHEKCPTESEARTKRAWHLYCELYKETQEFLFKNYRNLGVDLQLLKSRMTFDEFVNCTTIYQHNAMTECFEI